jgi:hypothetical protein
MKLTRYTSAVLVIPAAVKVDSMDTRIGSWLRTLADYTVGTAIVMVQLTLADRRRRAPALPGGRAR